MIVKVKPRIGFHLVCGCQDIDGANSFQQFIFITLPMLRALASIAVVIQLINEFRTYDLPYADSRRARDLD